MAELNEIRSQIETARQLAAQKRAETEQIKQQLQEQEQSIPNTNSQQALRNKYSGLQGQQFRQQAETMRSQIGQNIQSANEYENNVITPYEQNISNAQGQLRDIEAQQNAIDTINKAADQGNVGYYAQFGEGYERKLAQKYLKGQDIVKEYSNRLGSAISEYNKTGSEDAFNSRGLNLDTLQKEGRLKVNQSQTSSQFSTGQIASYPSNLNAPQVKPTQNQNRINNTLSKINSFTILPSVSANQTDIQPTNNNQNYISNYDNQIRNLYKSKLKNPDIHIIETKDLSPSYNGYAYPTGVIKLNPTEADMLSLKNGEKISLTQAHEFGHLLDFKYKELPKDTNGKTDYSFFKDSDTLGTPTENKVYTSQFLLNQEYPARAFSNFISDPAYFKQKYPQQAKVFEKAIGFSQLPNLPLSVPAGTPNAVLNEFGGWSPLAPLYSRANLNTPQPSVNRNIFTGSMLPLVGAVTSEPKTDIVTINGYAYNSTTGKAIPSIRTASKSPKRDLFKRNIANEGYIKGTIETAGNLLSGIEAKRQQKSGDYYQSQGMLGLAQAAPQLVYTAPYLGQALLVAGGAESLATSSGQKRLQQQMQSRTATGWNPTVAGLVTYGQPIAEIGLGGLGLKSEYGGLKASREMTILENAPTKVVGKRILNAEGGTDFVYGLKQTTPSWFESKVLRIKPTTQITRINQPFAFSGENRVILEGGRGETLTLQGNKLGASIFDVSGVSQSRGGGFRVGKTIKGSSVSYDTGMSAGGGYVNIRERLASQGIINKEYDIITGQPKYTYKGNIIRSDAQAKKMFIGGSKETSNVIQLMSGEPTKALFSKSTGTGVIRGKANVFGYLQKVNMPAEEDMLFGGLKVIQKGKGAGTASYLGTALKEGAKLGAKAISKPVSASSGLNILNSILPSVSASSQEQRSQGAWTGKGMYEKTSDTSSITGMATVTKGKDDFKTITGLNINQATSNKTNQKVAQISKQREGIKFASGLAQMFGTSEMSRQKLNFGQITQQKTKQAQRQRVMQGQSDMFGEGTTPTGGGGSVVFSSSNSEGTKGKVIKVSGRYLIMIRRYGQDRVVAEASSLSEAKQILRENLQTTLAASGFVISKQTGQKQDVNDLFGDMFTPSKRDTFRVVQRRGKRLSSQSEVFGIQSARKQKSNNWFSGFGNSKAVKRGKTFKWF